MIKKWSNFINENKLYLFNRKFRISSLIESKIYPLKLVKKWMSEYDCDQFAHCVLVSKSPITKTTDVKYLIQTTSRDISNVNYFNTSTKKYDGYLPEDSKLIINEQEVFLYIFKKNSNLQNRARQIHGFIYEGEVKNLNGLAKLKKTDKWDAEGGLDKSYLTRRIEQQKSVEFFNGSTYLDLVKIDEISGFKECNWELVPQGFKDHHNWSIKCMANRTDIEFGDFKRISGLEKDGKKIKILHSNEQNFMIAIGFHDGSADKKVLVEYIICMPVSIWKTFLPNLQTKLEDITMMYNDLDQHKLVGERTEESEKNWQYYTSIYKGICSDTPIKLRFKRDSKGQLRIQCAMSFTNFTNLVLKLPHIRIG